MKRRVQDLNNYKPVADQQRTKLYSNNYYVPFVVDQSDISSCPTTTYTYDTSPSDYSYSCYNRSTPSESGVTASTLSFDSSFYSTPPPSAFFNNFNERNTNFLPENFVIGEEPLLFDGIEEHPAEEFFCSIDDFFTEDEKGRNNQFYYHNYDERSTAPVFGQRQQQQSCPQWHPEPKRQRYGDSDADGPTCFTPRPQHTTVPGTSATTFLPAATLQRHRPTKEFLGVAGPFPPSSFNFGTPPTTASTSSSAIDDPLESHHNITTRYSKIRLNEYDEPSAATFQFPHQNSHHQEKQPSFPVINSQMVQRHLRMFGTAEAKRQLSLDNNHSQPMEISSTAALGLGRDSGGGGDIVHSHHQHHQSPPSSSGASAAYFFGAAGTSITGSGGGNIGAPANNNNADGMGFVGGTPTTTTSTTTQMGSSSLFQQQHQVLPDTAVNNNSMAEHHQQQHPTSMLEGMGTDAISQMSAMVSTAGIPEASNDSESSCHLNRKRTLSFSKADTGHVGSTTSGISGIEGGNGEDPLAMLSCLDSSVTSSTGPGCSSGGGSKPQRAATKVCRVCGDKAYSYNFNVITCESCKAFFRRNANKEKEIRCPFSENCEITVVSRRFCQRCRLHKCFKVGMKKEWIMTEEARLEKKQRIQDNRERRLAEQRRMQDEMEAQEELERSILDGAPPQSSATATANVNIGEIFPGMLNQQPITQITDRFPKLDSNCENSVLSTDPLQSTSTQIVQPLTAVVAAAASIPAAAALLSNLEAKAADVALHQPPPPIIEQQQTAIAQACAEVQQAVAAIALKQQQHNAASAVLDHQQNVGCGGAILTSPAGTTNAAAVILGQDPSQALPTVLPVVVAPAATQLAPIVALQDAATVSLGQQQQSLVQPPPIATSSLNSLAAQEIRAAQNLSALASSFQHQQQQQHEQQQQQQQMTSVAAATQQQLLAAAVAVEHQKQQQAAAVVVASQLQQAQQMVAAQHQQQQQQQQQYQQQPTAAQIVAAAVQQQQQQQIVAAIQHQQQKIVAAAVAAAVAEQQQIAHAQQQCLSGGSGSDQSAASSVSASVEPLQHQQQQQNPVINSPTNTEISAQLAAVAAAQNTSLQQTTSVPTLPQVAAAFVAQQQHQQQQELAAAAAAASSAASVEDATMIDVSSDPSPSSTSLQSQPAAPPPSIQSICLQQIAAASGQPPPSTAAAAAALAAASAVPSAIQTAAQQIVAPIAKQIVAEVVANISAAASSTCNSSGGDSAISTAIASAIPAAAAQSAAAHFNAAATGGTVATTAAGAPILVPAAAAPPSVTASTAAAANLLGLAATGSIQPSTAAAAAMLAASSAPQMPMQQQMAVAAATKSAMIAVPVDLLMRLLEEKFENDQEKAQQQQQTTAPNTINTGNIVQSPPTKCCCRCQCGRYPGDIPIVDRVMADLLEGSSKHMIQQQSSANSSTGNTPSLSNMGANQIPQQFETGLPLRSGSDAASSAALAQHHAAMLANMGGNGSPGGLTLADQEVIAELNKANDVWLATSMGQNLLEELQPTESNLRRLIATANSIRSFRVLDRNDQIQILRRGCEGFFILRGLLSYNDTSSMLLRQAGVADIVLQFYAEFPLEWRSNSTANLLMGILYLFNSEIQELKNPIALAVENMKYQSLLKRLIHSICAPDSAKASLIAADIILRVDQLRQSLGFATCSVQSEQQLPHPQPQQQQQSDSQQHPPPNLTSQQQQQATVTLIGVTSDGSLLATINTTGTTSGPATTAMADVGLSGGGGIPGISPSVSTGTSMMMDISGSAGILQQQQQAQQQQSNQTPNNEYHQ